MGPFKLLAVALLLLLAQGRSLDLPAAPWLPVSSGELGGGRSLLQAGPSGQPFQVGSHAGSAAASAAPVLGPGMRLQACGAAPAARRRAVPLARARMMMFDVGC